MKSMMMKMGALQLAAIAAGMEAMTTMDKTPRPRMDVSKPATLSRKEWTRRKRRRTLAKHSRRQNRY